MLQVGKCKNKEEEEANIPTSACLLPSTDCINCLTESTYCNNNNNRNPKRKFMFRETENINGTEDISETLQGDVSGKITNLEDTCNHPGPGNDHPGVMAGSGADEFERDRDEGDDGEEIASHREEDDDDEEEEDEILLCPIRAETYILDENDAAFVASDNEVEMASSFDVKAEVNAYNILPEATRRSRQPPKYMHMVPTPDDDALLVDDGETSSDSDDPTEATVGSHLGPNNTDRNVHEDEDLLDEIDGEWLPETPLGDEGDEETEQALDPGFEGDSSELDDIAEWDDDL